MAIREANPLLFRATGIADSVDALFDGSCQSLQNLIFDRTNRGSCVPRPGVVQVTNFPGFSSPGVVSVMLTVGTLVYGMVATARTPGFDEPFIYDTVAEAFITVTGVTAGNVPATQGTTGDWTPPTMDVVGTKVVVTHPGFSGSNFIGWFDTTTYAWSAGNTSTNALPSVPLWVAQFFGRAYYGIKNTVYMSDPLAATVIGATSIANVLTPGDSTNTLVAKGLPLNTSTGGILGSLIVFKAGAIFQITGDPSLSNLSLNTLAINIGCQAPRSVASTPVGIFFISTDGPRVVNLAGQVAYLQPNGNDVVAPFASAPNPSRMCAAYNNSTYRVAFDTSWTVWNSVYTYLDYWFDLMSSRWNGSHTFQYHCAIPVGSSFYLASNTAPGALYQSDAVLSESSVYQDLGTSYNCLLVSAAMNGAPMTMSQIVESTIELCSSASSASYYLVGYDDQNNPLSIATISLKTPQPLLGSSKFGQFDWRSSQVASTNLTIPWVNPIVCKKLILYMRVVAAEFVSIKTASFRVQPLRYTNVVI
jgi:hypothetical protein